MTDLEKRIMELEEEKARLQSIIDFDRNFETRSGVKTFVKRFEKFMVPELPCANMLFSVAGLEISIRPVKSAKKVFSGVTLEKHEEKQEVSAKRDTSLKDFPTIESLCNWYRETLSPISNFLKLENGKEKKKNLPELAYTLYASSGSGEPSKSDLWYPKPARAWLEKNFPSELEVYDLM